ncbi:hypothetical protein BofuT4_uP000130.1 [Botrytis cinerea T4]|uniref:Uncharacterized protein n=1 Tax=Botryotinia fuckeliana (strain T4) TaxID=999810 RepID=G2YLR8_BOTF4|nr:hypothetical protein BofuT4_uP000130.1 [Botrytis cinerea T4]
MVLDTGFEAYRCGNYITARGDAEMSGGFWMCNMCVTYAEKKTSHCGRSLSSSEKTRYDVEERINRGSESNYREILQNTVTEMWYPVRLSGAM